MLDAGMATLLLAGQDCPARLPHSLLVLPPPLRKSCWLCA
jgi:hypothetical protein